MADAFDRFTSESPSLGNPATSIKKGDAFDRYQGPDEPLWKSASRTALQVPQGLAEVTPYGIATGLWSLLGHGEVNDPEEIEHIRRISEREGVPFNEENYLQAGQQALDTIPTVSNLARELESSTGIPLEPKNRLQKGLRFASSAAKVVPKPSSAAPRGYAFRGTNTGLPRPVLGAGVEGARELLIELGIPEPIADVAAFSILKPTSDASGIFKVGASRKESGLTNRRYENLEKPREVSKSTINKINHATEKEFKDLTNQIIESSPIKETHQALANDASFKSTARDGFKKVQDLSETFPETFETAKLKSELESSLSNGKNQGITPSEFDKARGKFIKQFIDDTPDTPFTSSGLVKQYRKNNKQLSEAYEPGQSFAYNRAKREALLEYNRVIADMIEKEFPNTDFSKLFKETNQRWSQISDSEAISKFLDNVFNEKTDFKQVRKIFDKEGMNVPFKRAMGEEGFAKFETLLKDLLSTEQANKLLKVAEGKGMGDLVKTIGSYALHPNVAKAKFGFDVIKGGYQKIYNMLLDKPKLAITWDRGINALKRGEFKAAEKELGKIKEAEKAFDASETTRRAALKKFSEKKPSSSEPKEYKIKTEKDPDRSRFSRVKTIEDKNGQFSGELTYDIEPNEIFISNINIDENLKRQGLASKLFKQLIEEHPDKAITISPLKPDGAKFFSKITGRDLKPQISESYDKLPGVSQEPNKLNQKDISNAKKNLAIKSEIDRLKKDQEASKASRKNSQISSILPKPYKGELKFTNSEGKEFKRSAEIYDGIFSISKDGQDYVVSHIPTGASLATYKSKKSALQLMKDLFEDNLIDKKYIHNKTMEKAGRMIKDRHALLERINKYR